VTPLLSVYCDLVRFGAALVMLLGHAWTIPFPNHPLRWPGTQAVVVFFVLSGFVIAFVADGREKAFVEYALRRAARVWSVAIPAILLAGIITFAVGTSKISVAAPPTTSLADLVGRSVTNLLFLGQLWTLDIQSPISLPTHSRFISITRHCWRCFDPGCICRCGRRQSVWSPPSA
jgi:peptidoglycan/LPS O-acetylase OafA/YrhL